MGVAPDRVEPPPITYDLTGAIKNLDHFLEQDRDCPAVNFTLGVLYNNHDLPDRARAAFEAVLNSGLKNQSLRSKARFKLARIDIKRGDYKQAADEFNHALKMASVLLQFPSITGLLRTTKQINIARDRYRKQFQRDPENINLAYLLARIASRERDYDESVGLYQRAIDSSLRPQDRISLYGRLVSAAARGGLCEKMAREYLSRVEKDPHYCEGYLFLAMLYSNRGRPGEAIRIVREGVKTTPGQYCFDHG